MALKARSIPPVGLTTPYSVALAVLTIILLVLATLMVVLRYYAKRLTRQKANREDYLIWMALFIYYIHSILSYLGLILGGDGHHANTLSPSNLMASLQVLAGMGVVYGVELTLSKWSILFFYKRVFFLQTRRTFRYITYLTMGLVFCFGVLAATCTWALCVPIDFNWDETIPGGYCVDRDAVFLAVGVLDAVTDVMIMLLPLPIIYKLQMPNSNKFGLAIIFMVAIVSVIMSGLRAAYTVQIDFSDFTYSTFNVFIFSLVEPGTSIMVSSSLLLRPLYDKWINGKSPSSQSHDTTASKRSFSRIQEPGVPLRNTRASRSEQLEPDSLELGNMGTESTVGTMPHRENDAGIYVRNEFSVESGV